MTTKTQEKLATPLRCMDYEIGNNDRWIQDVYGAHVANLCPSQDIADEIVHRCNLHEELVALAEEVQATATIETPRQLIDKANALLARCNKPPSG